MGQSGPQAAPSHQVPAAGRPASLLHTLCCTVFSHASAHVTSTLVFSNPCPLHLTWWLSNFSQYMCVCVCFCMSVCVTALLVQAGPEAMEEVEVVILRFSLAACNPGSLHLVLESVSPKAP